MGIKFTIIIHCNFRVVVSAQPITFDLFPSFHLHGEVHCVCLWAIRPSFRRRCYNFHVFVFIRRRWKRNDVECWGIYTHTFVTLQSIDFQQKNFPYLVILANQKWRGRNLFFVGDSWIIAYAKIAASDNSSNQQTHCLPNSTVQHTIWIYCSCLKYFYWDFHRIFILINLISGATNWPTNIPIFSVNPYYYRCRCRHHHLGLSVHLNVTGPNCCRTTTHVYSTRLINSSCSDYIC